MDTTFHTGIEAAVNVVELSGLTCDKEIPSVPSVEKVMLKVFWDPCGLLLLDFIPQNTTINVEHYSSTLSRLWLSSVEITEGFWMCTTWLPCTTMRRHPLVTFRTADKLQPAHWESVNPPSYSLDHAPSNFCVLIGWSWQDSDSRATIKTS